MLKNLPEKEARRIGAYKNSITELEADGYTVIRSFFSLNEVDKINTAVDLLEQHIDQNSDELARSKKGMKYNDLAAMPRTLVDVRGNNADYDGGMIDIFNPHIWIQKHAPEIESLLSRLHSDYIIGIISSIGHRFDVGNTNIYIHRGVLNPRVPHIDSLRPFVKIFCALTDHSVAGCGPLLIAPASHKRKSIHFIMARLNLLRRALGGKNNVDDAPIYKRENMTRLLLKPGDLAICNLASVHSAEPAAQSGYRRTYVQTYRYQ